MTDERIDEALRRAAEMLDAHKAMPYEPPPNFETCAVRGSGGYWWAVPEQALAGWAEAIQAHAERPESEHDGGCSAGISKAPCKCSQRDRADAVAKFCDAMLGGDDE